MGSKVAPGGAMEMTVVREYRGPVKNRSCTDVFCLILFIAFLVGWGIVGYFAFSLGDPQRIIHPTDSQGRMCGFSQGVEDKPFLYFFDLAKCATPTALTHGCPTPQVCVANCPNENFLAVAEALKIGESETKKKMICKENVTLSAYSVEQLTNKGLCATYYVQSKPITKRCIPTLLMSDSATPKIHEMSQKSSFNFSEITSGAKVIGHLASFSKFFEKVCEDLSQVWWIILLMMALAGVSSFIWIVLMKYIAGVMVWLSIVAIMILQAIGLWYCFERYMDLRYAESNVTLADVAFSTNFDTYLSVKETWLIFLIVLGLTAIILLFTIIFLRNRINLAVALIKQASRAVNDTMCTLTFPFFPWVFQVLVVGYFFVLLAYNFSIGQSTYKVVGSDNTPSNCSCPLVIDKEGTCSPIGFRELCGKQCPGDSCLFVPFGGNRNYQYILQGYNLFGLFWVLFFIHAFEELVLAKVFASWYWAFRKPDDLPSLPILGSIATAIRYHLGTVAFGSLIIAIIRSIRVMLEYIERKMKKYNDNLCCKCVSWTCKCCFWLLEKFMRFVNRNAYIMCAMTGKNFCASASDAFNLLLRNVVRVFVLDKVTDALLFLGRLVVIGGVGAAAYYSFTQKLDPSNYYLVPMLTTIIGAYFVTGVFFSVYAMAVDTLFLCFLHDTEINDGSVEKPYYMPVGLMEVVGKKNKQPGKKSTGCCGCSN